MRQRAISKRAQLLSAFLLLAFFASACTDRSSPSPESVGALPLAMIATGSFRIDLERSAAVVADGDRFLLALLNIVGVVKNIALALAAIRFIS